ncbi:unnamed protein product, partial [Closterium sp. NIES-54]
MYWQGLTTTDRPAAAPTAAAVADGIAAAIVASAADPPHLQGQHPLQTDPQTRHRLHSHLLLMHQYLHHLHHLHLHHLHLSDPFPLPYRLAPPQAPRPLFLTTATTATATAATVAASAAPACCTAMASLRVLAFDHEGRPVQFDTWLDDLHLYLLSNIKDGVSLFDHVSGAATAPPTTADGATRSEWLSRDGAARLAIRNHLPLAECSHFGQHRTAQALYDAVVARYSTPATAALGRLLVPYLFPELSAFATVEDLVLLVALRARPSLRGAPPPPLPPRTPLLLLPTSLLLRISGLLLLVQSAAVARARVARELEVAAVVVEVAAGVVVGVAVEVVAAVGLVEGVGALVAAVEAAVGVSAVAAVGMVAGGGQGGGGGGGDDGGGDEGDGGGGGGGGGDRGNGGNGNGDVAKRDRLRRGFRRCCLCSRRRCLRMLPRGRSWSVPPLTSYVRR